MLILAALFLATVTKVPFPVRFELAAISLVSSVVLLIARILDSAVLEIYAKGIGRLSVFILVGYAIVPNFDASFSPIVLYTANGVGHYATLLRSYVVRT